MSLTLVAQIWLLVGVLDISGRAIFYALFVGLDKTSPMYAQTFQRVGVWVLWAYTLVAVFVVVAFGLGFGVSVMKAALVK